MAEVEFALLAALFFSISYFYADNTNKIIDMRYVL